MPKVPGKVYLLSGGTRYYGLDPSWIAERLTSLRIPSDSFVGKANGFIARREGSSVGYILLNRSALDQIDASLKTHSLVFDTGTTGSVTIANLHISDAFAVAGTQNQSLSDVYLVELRTVYDHARYTSVNKVYNVRTPDWYTNTTADYLATSLNAGSLWTWATMVANIWTNISPIAGALTTALTDFPTAEPQNFHFPGCSALEALEHICSVTDHHLVLKRDGTFHVVSSGNADTANQTLITNYLEQSLHPSWPTGGNDAVSIPAKVRVFFPKRNPAFQGSTDSAVNTSAELFHGDSSHSVDVTVASLLPTLTGTITGTVYPLFDPTPALYDELGTIQNASALTTQAEKRTTELVQGMLNANRRDDLYHGAIGFEVGPKFSAVHWYDFGDGIRTQCFSSPKKTDGGGDDPVTEWPNFADLARWHIPHERFAIGVVYGASGIAANSSGTVRVQYGTRTSASVTTWANTSLPHEITAHEIYGNTYMEGQRVVCMYHRQTSRWVVISDIGQLGLVRFELTGTLVLSDHAPAKLREPDGSGGWQDVSPTVEIEVYDPHGSEGMWSGLSGYEGFAIPRNQSYLDTTPDPDETRAAYDIVWMERKAQQIRGTTNEYIGASVAGRVGVVVDWYDHQGKNPGNTVDCYDPNNLFPATFSGAEVLAEYNNHAERYELIQAQQVVRFATALLNGSLCGSGTATIDNFAGIPQSLDVGAPPTTPTSVDNAGAHAGIDNDPVLIMRTNNSMPNPSWTLIRTKRRLRKPITVVEISGSNLQYKTVDIYVEVCDVDNSTGTQSSPTTIAGTTTACP